MRLRRLELTRYGHFEGAALDFGAVRDTGSDAADVTIVFGANEAGKSTAFAAWLDLLYGFQPRNHPYAFRFERKDLLVGAEVETPDGTLHLRRTPKASGSLLDGDGREVSEQRLAGLLHGLDRNAYKTRFSLDDTVLRAGGAEIAEAKGDLGRLLHAGTSGLSGLSQVLEGVKAEVDEFYRKGGSAQRLPTAKRDLKALDAQLRELRLSPMRFDDLSRAVAGCEAAIKVCDAALAEARRGLALAEAAARRRELRAEQAALSLQLDKFPDGPDLAPGAAMAVVQAAAEAREAQRKAALAEQEREGAETALRGLDADPEGLEIGPLIEAIQGLVFDEQPLLLRVGGAEADLEKLRLRRTEAGGAAQALAERLGGTGVEPREMVLAPLKLDALRSCLQALHDARQDLRNATDAAAEARDSHGEAPSDAPGEPALADALDRMRAEAPNLDALREDRDRTALAANAAAEGLGDDWRARLAAAGGLPAEEELSAAVQATERQTDLLGRAETEIAATKFQRATAEALVDAAAKDPRAIDFAELQRHRLVREAAWSVHKATLDVETAEAFETAMRADDAASAAHAESAEARALLQARRDELKRAVVAEKVAEDALETTQKNARRAAERLAEFAPRLLLQTVATDEAFLPRRRMLARAIETSQLHDAACNAFDHAEARQKRLDAALRVAMEASGAGAGEVPPMVAARLRLAELRAADQARVAWEKAHAQVQLLDRRAVLAQQQLDLSEAELVTAAADSWAAGMTPDALRAALPVAADLAVAIGKLDDLDHRIVRMDEALRIFETAATRLRQIVGPAPTADALMQAARLRNGTAEKRAERIETETQRRQAATTDAAAAAAALTEASALIEQHLNGQAARGDATAVDFVNQLTERDRLRGERRRKEDDIARASVGLDPEMLAREEAITDPARITGLRDTVDRAEAAASAAVRDAGAAERDLSAAMGAAGGAAADQQRAILLEDLHAGARDAAARMIGLAAASAALHRLGDSRRDPMLRDTEAAFLRLTGGAWSRLRTWSEGGERLVGDTNGRSVPADGMSTGTRAQLYLALRIAGHAAFLRDAGPLPFVTDDILESFDDARAAAALELTAELGQRGQAILFTHHAHLVEMARDTIPDVRILQMPQRAGTDAP